MAERVIEVSSKRSTPLRVESLREQAHTALRGWIVTGEILAGEIYTIGGIAGRLGVSATPVREAVLDLANEGLVEVVRNRGFRVPVLSAKDLDDLSELRLLLEVPSVVSVINKLTPDDLSDLRNRAQRTISAGKAKDLNRFLEEDRRFHTRLLEAVPNRRLADMVVRLRDQTRLYGFPRLAQAGQLLGSAQEHAEIVEALASGDETAARLLVNRHLRHIRGSGADALKAQTPGSQPGNAVRTRDPGEPNGHPRSKAKRLTSPTSRLDTVS